MLVSATAWCTQALKAAAPTLAVYRLACSCPLAVEVCSIPFTYRSPDTSTYQLLLVRSSMLA